MHMFETWTKPICIVRTRQLKIQDLVFSLRTRKTSYSSLETLEQAGLVYDLQKADETDLLNLLVDLHPVEYKNFEHFLMNPPNDVLPSQIRQALASRTRMIPTLFIVYFDSKHQPTYVEKISDYYQLLAILSEARENDLVPPPVER